MMPVLSFIACFGSTAVLVFVLSTAAEYETASELEKATTLPRQGPWLPTIRIDWVLPGSYARAAFAVQWAISHTKDVYWVFSPSRCGCEWLSTWPWASWS